MKMPRESGQIPLASERGNDRGYGAPGVACAQPNVNESSGLTPSFLFCPPWDLLSTSSVSSEIPLYPANDSFIESRSGKRTLVRSLGQGARHSASAQSGPASAPDQMENDQQDYRPKNDHSEAPPVPSGRASVTEETHEQMHEGTTDYTRNGVVRVDTLGGLTE